MRRAMSPVICTKRTSPRGVRTVTEAWTLSLEASCFQAARNFPGRRVTSTTSPATGERLTCTLKIERKMLICVPPSAWGRISITLPSAGETSVSGSAGIARAGSRKNQVTNSASTSATPAAARQCSSGAEQRPGRRRGG